MKAVAKISVATAIASAATSSVEAGREPMLGRKGRRGGIGARAPKEDAEIGKPHPEAAPKANAHIQGNAHIKHDSATGMPFEEKTEDAAPAAAADAGALEVADVDPEAPEQDEATRLAAEEKAAALEEFKRKQAERAEEEKEQQRLRKVERKAQAHKKHRDFFCPLTRRVMKDPVRLYGDADKDDEGNAEVDSEGREVRNTWHNFERDWIVRWIEEKGTDPLDQARKVTVDDLEDDEDLKAEVGKWAKRERYTWTVPSAKPKEDTEFVDFLKGLDETLVKGGDMKQPILDHAGVQKIVTNSAEGSNPELAAGIDAQLVKDLSEIAAWPGMLEKENPDLRNPDDDHNGSDFDVADLKAECAKMARFRRMAWNLQHIHHDDHRGSGKTQRAVVGYDSKEGVALVSVMGHTSAHEWHFDMERVEEAGFTMKGDSKNEKGEVVPGNMDTPVVGAEEANTNGRFDDVVVHSHYYQEWKHLKFNAEYSARGGKRDCGGVRDYVTEWWKIHREDQLDKSSSKPLRVIATGHGSGGAIADFMVLDLSRDTEKLEALKDLPESVNPWKCEDLACLVKNEQIDFSLVTFGAPRVMNKVAKQHVEDACWDKARNQTRAVRVNMIFDPVHHFAGPKDVMAEEHAKLFLPVGQEYFLAPMMNKQAIKTGEDFKNAMKDKEQAVAQIEAVHALSQYQLALKGGEESNVDALFKADEEPFAAATDYIAKTKGETVLGWIRKHIYNPTNPFKQMFGGNMGKNKGLGNMFNNILGNQGGQGGNNYLNDLMGKLGGMGGPEGARSEM